MHILYQINNSLSSNAKFSVSSPEIFASNRTKAMIRAIGKITKRKNEANFFTLHHQICFLRIYMLCLKHLCCSCVLDISTLRQSSPTHNLHAHMKV